MPTAAFVAKLVLVTAVTAIAPRLTGAEPSSWQHVCQGLNEFTGRLTDYRNQGTDLNDAIAAALPELRLMPDRVVAVEIAQQVYATPGLSRKQEIAAIYSKCAAAADGGAALAEQQPTVRITDLEAIPLKPGPNHVAKFTPDGRDATITLTWHDEGNGRGQDVFGVTIQNRNGIAGRDIELLPPSAAASVGTVTDEPHRGDDMLRSLRFARGRVNGQNAGLLLMASRVEGNDPAPSETVYEVYQLAQIAAERNVGTGESALENKGSERFTDSSQSRSALVQDNDRDGFERIVQSVLPGRYCNADMALTVASGLPLRSSYRGPRNLSGDFTRDGCYDPQATSGRSPASVNQRAASPSLRTTDLSQQDREKLFQQFSASMGEKAQH